MHRFLLAIALLGGLLVAPAGAFARGAEPDGPTYQMPTVGECHVATSADYTLLTQGTGVDCSEEHTVLVSGVVVLPDDTEWVRGGEDLEAAAELYCLPAFYEAIGKPFKVIARTAYVWKYWYPNATQRSHGASWFRCDVVLAGYAQFVPLPVPLVTGTKVPERIQTCLMVVGESIYASSCKDQFNWHLDKVFVVPGDAYPKRKTLVKFSKTHCPAAKHHKPWRSLWVSPAMWAYGDHTLICYREA